MRTPVIALALLSVIGFSAQAQQPSTGKDDTDVKNVFNTPMDSRQAVCS